MGIKTQNNLTCWSLTNSNPIPWHCLTWQLTHVDLVYHATQTLATQHLGIIVKQIISITTQYFGIISQLRLSTGNISRVCLCMCTSVYNIHHNVIFPILIKHIYINTNNLTYHTVLLCCRHTAALTSSPCIVSS